MLRWDPSSDSKTAKTCKFDQPHTKPFTDVSSGRKIDSMIKPYGYKYEKGKIVANHGTGTEATAKADVSKGGNSNEETPKSVKKAVKSKGKKRSASPEDGDDTPKAGKKLKTTKTKEAEEEPDATDASEAPELKEEDGEE